MAGRGRAGSLPPAPAGRRVAPPSPRHPLRPTPGADAPTCGLRSTALLAAIRRLRCFLGPAATIRWGKEAAGPRGLRPLRRARDALPLARSRGTLRGGWR